jgi:hypothetical protein
MNLQLLHRQPTWYQLTNCMRRSWVLRMYCNCIGVQIRKEAFWSASILKPGAEAAVTVSIYCILDKSHFFAKWMARNYSGAMHTTLPLLSKLSEQWCFMLLYITPRFPHPLRSAVWSSLCIHGDVTTLR